MKSPEEWFAAIQEDAVESGRREAAQTLEKWARRCENAEMEVKRLSTGDIGRLQSQCRDLEVANRDLRLDNERLSKGMNEWEKKARERKRLESQCRDLEQQIAIEIREREQDNGKRDELKERLKLAHQVSKNARKECEYLRDLLNEFRRIITEVGHGLLKHSEHCAKEMAGEPYASQIIHDPEGS